MSTDNQTTFSVDPRMLVTRPGDEITVRLIRIAPKDSNRYYPFVIRYTHTVVDPSAPIKKTKFALCASTPYLRITDAFNKCPCCSAAQEYWEKAKDTSITSLDEIRSNRDKYGKFRRRFNFFIPVYVISDRNNPSNVGSIKILHLSDKTEVSTLRELIDSSIKSKREVYNKLADPHALNLVIKTITEHGEYAEYRRNTFKFISTTEPVVDMNKIDKDKYTIDFKKKIDALQFDRDFFTEYDESTIDSIYQTIKSQLTNVQPKTTIRSAAELIKGNQKSESAPNTLASTAAKIKTELKKTEVVKPSNIVTDSNADFMNEIQKHVDRLKKLRAQDS